MYRREGDRITLTIEVNPDEYILLLAVMGMALYHARETPNRGFWVMMRLVNRLNAGNPEFAPYEIPAGIFPEETIH